MRNLYNKTKSQSWMEANSGEVVNLCIRYISKKNEF